MYRILLIITVSVFFCCNADKKNITGVEKEMELIESLMQIETDAASFVVNTGVASVPLSYSGGANDGRLVNKNGDSFLPAGDNFVILSVGYVLPMSFEILSVLNGVNPDNPAIYLTSEDRATLQAPLEPGHIYIPFPNFEYNYGTFYTGIQKDVRLNFYLQNTINISMINVPAALNGLTFYVPVFAKVMHNLTLLP